MSLFIIFTICPKKFFDKNIADGTPKATSKQNKQMFSHIEVNEKKIEELSKSFNDHFVEVGPKLSSVFVTTQHLKKKVSKIYFFKSSNT